MRFPRPVGRLVALLAIPAGLVCLAFPFAQLAFAEDTGLIDDTRAYFGAGTAADVPKVSDVSCFSRRYGTTRRGWGDWSCTLYLDTRKPQPEGDPFAGMTSDEAFEESMRRTRAEIDALLEKPNFSGKIERTMPSDHSGRIPALRQLSGEGEPPRFGVIWGSGDLAWRWLHFLLLGGVMVAIGLGCLWAARAIWRKYS